MRTADTPILLPSQQQDNAELRASQLVGSQADQQVLLEQPLFEIVDKLTLKRDRRIEKQFYVNFPE